MPATAGWNMEDPIDPRATSTNSGQNDGAMPASGIKTTTINMPPRGKTRD